MAISRRGLIIGAAIGGVALYGTGYCAGSYQQTSASAYRRVTGRSSVLQTSFGDLELAIAGRGPPFLMLHGTGGGFDQGLLFARGLIGRDLQVIAPSRFGYLRSAFPADPSPANQADALVELLDHLGIDKIPVAGGSAGALPAAFFAQRHPDRCSALVLLVPAANLSNRDPVEFTRLQQFLVGRLLTSDFWFWSMLKLAPRQLIGTLLATDPALLDSVSALERDRADAILDDLMPIRPKVRGMMNDGHFSGQPTDIDFARIKAPMLIISAEDDRFGTAETARLIAARAADAKLVIYPTGGHIWLGHDDDLSDEIVRFIAPAKGQSLQ